MIDIRDIKHATPEEITDLNFLHLTDQYVLRRHNYQGLRSHVFQILKTDDVRKANEGVIKEGIKKYPQATPLNILRIMRKKFKSLDDVLAEIRKYKLIEKYFDADSYAKSQEIVVDYNHGGKNKVMLIGIQDYVEGFRLNPWSTIIGLHIVDFLKISGIKNIDETVSQIRKNVADFVQLLKDFILKTRHIPDLAGIGNIMLKRDGTIVLVDINNISEVSFSDHIYVDDFGYPIVDRSIEAIFCLDKFSMPDEYDRNCFLYQEFLSNRRCKKVDAIEKDFDHQLNPYYSSRVQDSDTVF